MANYTNNITKVFKQAYSKAGKKHGMTAYEMQAATWVAWKRMHNV